MSRFFESSFFEPPDIIRPTQHGHNLRGDAAQALRLLGLAPAEHGETLRPDEILPSTDRAEVMREAPETDGRFFKVPKVIER